MSDEYKRDVIKKAIDAIERCFKNEDVETALVLIHLCKMVDDNFAVYLER